jgi:hypothetical protein
MNNENKLPPILDDETFFNRLKLSNIPEDMKNTIVNNYNKLINETQLKSILYLGLKNKILTDHEENFQPVEFISILDEKRMNYLNDFEIDIDIQDNTTKFKIISKFQETILK